MLTQENEYYIRLILLIVRGGTLVLKQILSKKLEDQNLQLHGFIQGNREQINQLRKDNVLTLKQYHILFPNNGTMTQTDICKLDISLLSFLLLNHFFPLMQKSEEEAIKQIKTLRNDFNAHHPDGSIDAQTFSRKYNELKKSIVTLGKELSLGQISALVEMIRCTREDPIDISHAIQDIKDLSGTTDQCMEHVSQQLEQMSLTLQRLSTCQKDTLAKMRKLEMELRTVIQNGKSDISTVIVGEVTVSGRNHEAVTAAAATLIDHAKRSKGYINRLHGAVRSGRQRITNAISTVYGFVSNYFTTPSESTSQKCVTALVQDIYDAGGEVIDVTEGSLLLHIRCQSVDAMLAVVKYFRSPVIDQRLKEIENGLTEESGCKINLSACIQIKALQEALHTIQEKQSSVFTKSVRFSVKCQNAEGVLNVFKVFEGRNKSHNISNLAKDLSNDVGDIVTLRTSVDTDTVQQYIDDAFEKNEAEHSAFKDESKSKDSLEEHEMDNKVVLVRHHDSTGTRQSLSNFIRLLQLRRHGYEFVAFVFFCSEGFELEQRFPYEELNTALQKLTGTDRRLLCSGDQDFLPGQFITGRYIRCMDRSAVVIMYVTKIFSRRDRVYLKIADSREMVVIPMFLEEDEENIQHLLKEIPNLSEVRIVMKIENGKCIFKRPCKDVCMDILEAAANAMERRRSSYRMYMPGMTIVGRQASTATGSLIDSPIHKIATNTDYERVLGTGEYMFVAVLLHHSEDRVFQADSVFEELNKTLQSLTGINRQLVCPFDAYEAYDRYLAYSFIRYLEMSSVVIVHVTKAFRDTHHEYYLQIADSCEKEIIPMILEEDEGNIKYFLKKGVRNLSKVRIVLKTENGKYIPKRPMKEVCEDILDIAATYSGQSRPKYIASLAGLDF